MNKVILMGRLTRDPDIRYSQGENQTCVARYTLAVDRRFKRDSDQSADFISCVSFGRTAEFLERYVKKGTKLCVEGRIQTGSYTDREGKKVYTTDVVVENAEFAESKAASGGGSSWAQQPAQPFMAQPGQPTQPFMAQSGQPAQPAQPGQPAQPFMAQPEQPTQPFMAPPQSTEAPIPQGAADNDGFISIPDGLDDEDLPFN